MIPRLWFALSIIWCALVCLLTHWGEINAESARAALLLAFSPFAFGLLVRVFFRYVVYGPRRRY